MEPIKLGRYRHFKGNEYEVVGLAKHSETLEDMVVYRALYGEFGLWVRPAAMWNETADSPISGNDGLYARPFTAADALDGAEARRHGGRPRAAEARRGEDRRVCRRA